MRFRDNKKKGLWKYIIPGRKKEWDDLCLLNQVVNIMEKLNSKEVPYDDITEEAEKEISHSGASLGWAVKMLLTLMNMELIMH